MARVRQCHYDGLGSVAALSHNNSIVEAYCYDAFGQVKINTAAGPDNNWLTPDGSTETASVYGNRFMFTGREYDAETGLYYYRARMYCPQLGRFLQPDPIGYADSMNLYQYCGNNPINFIDPWGLMAGQDPLSGDDALAQYARMNADDVAGQSVKECPKGWWQKTKDFFKEAWKKAKSRGDDAAKKAAEQTQKTVRATEKQLQSKFKHAKDFGVDGNYNPANAARFNQAIQQHINNPAVRQITGTYRGQPANIYVNPNTGLTVIQDAQGNFVSGWKLGVEQLKNVLTRGALN